MLFSKQQILKISSQENGKEMDDSKITGVVGKTLGHGKAKAYSDQSSKRLKKKTILRKQ